MSNFLALFEGGFSRSSSSVTLFLSVSGREEGIILAGPDCFTMAQDVCLLYCRGGRKLDMGGLSIWVEVSGGSKKPVPGMLDHSLSWPKLSWTPC